MNILSAALHEPEQCLQVSLLFIDTSPGGCTKINKKQTKQLSSLNIGYTYTTLLNANTLTKSFKHKITYLLNTFENLGQAIHAKI